MNNRIYLSYILIFQFWKIESISVGIIKNMSLIIDNTNSTIIDGTCNECLCHMYFNPSFSSFNCYTNNQTCQMHDKLYQNRSFQSITSLSTIFYFFSLPSSSLELTTTDSSLMIHNTTITGTHRIPVAYDSIYWSFDSTFNDQSSGWNFIPVNNVTFSSLATITGYGSSLMINATRLQYGYVSSPFLNLANHSWTFEVWIYLLSVSHFNDYSIVGQCQYSLSDRCLHLLVRYQRVYFGFYLADCSGRQNLLSVRWYHLAFVFNCSAKTQFIYINGFLDTQCQVNQCYQGGQANLTVGLTIPSSISTKYFDGYIDELHYFNRPKSSNEILDDASLTFYFSFDNQSFHDYGPLQILGRPNGSINFTTGRVGNALQIFPLSHSFFQVQGLVLFGVENQSYSLSIWIQPMLRASATIFHVSSDPDGFGWCITMLSLTSTSQLLASSWSGNPHYLFGPIIPLNQWTHVGITYRYENGLRLYVNGTLWNSTTSFGYYASGSQNYLFLGSSSVGTGRCAGSLRNDGQYSGLFDEFRLYSRELTTNETYTLAHP